MYNKKMDFKSILGKRLFLSIFLILLIFSDILFSIILNIFISNLYVDNFNNNSKKINEFKSRYESKLSQYSSLQDFLIKNVDLLEKDLNNLNPVSYFLTDSSLLPLVKSKYFDFNDNMIRYFLLPLLKENQKMRFYYNGLDMYTFKIENVKKKTFFLILSFENNPFVIKKIFKYFVIYKIIIVIFISYLIILLLKTIEKPVEQMKDIVKLLKIDLNYDNPDSFVKVFKDSLENLIEMRKIEKDANAVLNERLKKLEEDYKLKEGLVSLSQITSGIAHQLNNQLGSSIGILQKSIESNDTENLKVVLDDLKKLSDFTKKFIEFSKDHKPYMIEVDLKEIMDIVFCRFPLVFLKDFPDEKVFIKTDQILLEQALFNIFDNIVKYSQDKNVSIKIKKLLNKVELEITDSGPGFPDNILKNLYSPFNENAKGTGLGIPTVIKICSNLNIDCRFLNYDNKGKTILVFDYEKEDTSG